MSAQHTPGPWHVDIGHVSREHLKGRIQVAVWDEDDGCIAACMDSDANARLIAAAPDLLAALREIVQMTNEDTGTFRKRGGTYRGLVGIIAEAVVAKATGERP